MQYSDNSAISTPRDFTSADVTGMRGRVSFHQDGTTCRAWCEWLTSRTEVIWAAPLPAEHLVDGDANGLLAALSKSRNFEIFHRTNSVITQSNRPDLNCEHDLGAVSFEICIAVKANQKP